jgi:hypothetical protein
MPKVHQENTPWQWGHVQSPANKYTNSTEHESPGTTKSGFTRIRGALAVTVAGYVAYKAVRASVVTQTLPKDMSFFGSLLLVYAERYKVTDAKIEAAQYMQNSPGNLVASKNASAMLVPASTDVPANYVRSTLLFTSTASSDSTSSVLQTFGASRLASGHMSSAQGSKIGCRINVV